MKLLVDRNDDVKVIVYCWELDGEVEASHLKSDVPKENIKVVEKVEFSFRKPNYADSNVIIRNSNFKTEGEETSLNVSAFQEQVLRSLLIDWDMKDEDEQKIPVNNVSINNLIPSVARAAVSGVLDKIRI
ncbi:MAG: hypothetical protein ACXAC5_00180 [Promethearchaeota archaeon]